MPQRPATLRPGPGEVTFYPCSGEINRKLADPHAALQRVEARYHEAIGIDRTDGLSLEFPTWRFNLRSSNTEPVLRLNVETRQDPALLRKRPTNSWP